MEAVELINSCHVEQFHHFLLRKEMPRHVEHEAAMAVLRIVRDGKLRHCPFGPAGALRTIDLDGQELAKRLQTIEEAGTAGGAHLDYLVIDGELVALGGLCIVLHQIDRPLCKGFTLLHGQQRRSRRRRVGCKSLGHIANVLGGIDQRSEAAHGHGALAHRHFAWIGNHLDGGYGGGHIFLLDELHHSVGVVFVV